MKSVARSASAICIVFLAAMQTSHGQTVAGTIKDSSTSQPIADAEVTVVDTLHTVIAEATTDVAGEFRVAVEPGAYQLRVRRIGFAPTITNVFTLRPGQETIRVSVRVSSSDLSRAEGPYSLSPVVVEATTVQRHLETYYRHQALGGGQFVDRADFVRWHPIQASDLVRRLQGFSVDARGTVKREGQAQCSPLIYLDGAPLGDTESFDIDILPIDVIAAVEAYTSRLQAPIEYARPEAGCGILAFWTRSGAPNQVASPFELGTRIGTGISRVESIGVNVGVYLVTPFIGRLEFYPAFHYMVRRRSAREEGETRATSPPWP